MFIYIYAYGKIIQMFQSTNQSKMYSTSPVDFPDPVQHRRASH